MITLNKDTIDRDDINLLISWLQQDPLPRLTKGELTKQFEKEFSEYIGTKYSVMVNSGSSAILLMLAALLEGKRLKNKKIVVPNISWITDVSSPMMLGMKPILCDCNLEDLSVDLNHLEKIFINEKPSVLLLVSVLGLVPDMRQIKYLCKEYNVILLEDFCESLGSEYEKLKIGSFGLMGCTSMYFSHQINTLEGGMITTDDDELYNLLLMLRSHGWDRDLSLEEQKKLRKKWKISDFSSLYTFYYPGFNLRSTDLQAFIGIEQLKKIKNFVNKRNENFHLYRKNINNTMFIPNERKNDKVSNFAYPVISKNRDKIIKKLQENNIEVRPLISGSMGKQPFWVKKYGEQILKNSDLIDKYGFYIPNHHFINENDIKIISKVVNMY